MSRFGNISASCGCPATVAPIAFSVTLKNNLATLGKAQAIVFDEVSLISDTLLNSPPWERVPSPGWHLLHSYTCIYCLIDL
jgi:hypothetical protein